MSQTISPPQSYSAATSRQVGPVDIGWILVDKLDPLDQQAITAARDRVRNRLEKLFPEFQWRIHIEVREGLEDRFRQEPVEYLDWSLEQRDVRGWDYVITFVAADLHSVWQAQAWAAVSRPLDSAVISTARIDPRSLDTGAGDDERGSAIGRRVAALALRSLGHLCGLDVVAQPGNLMHRAESLAELDAAADLTDDQRQTMRENLLRIADLRLEEESPPQRLSRWSFYLKAGWRNRHEILSGIRQARPWRMPLRLSKLTMAALSTMVLLMMTAEAWDLATSQAPGQALLLSVVSILITAVYVTMRQRLLMRREHRRLTEQIVATQLTTLAIVAAGIVATYAGLFAITLLTASTFFGARLVSSWAGSLAGDIGWPHYFNFAAFVSAVGILVGAMGASFEGQHYFRHITLIDEEI